MDFSTVRKKLDKGAYANLEQFEVSVESFLFLGSCCLTFSGLISCYRNLVDLVARSARLVINSVRLMCFSMLMFFFLTQGLTFMFEILIDQ